jgi:hypothetical protein
MDWAGVGREHEACTMNAQLAGALAAAAELARHLERPRVAVRYDAAANRIRAALNARHWDAARGVYVDMVDRQSGKQYPRVSQHANAAMILWGGAPADRWAGMINRITDPERVTFTAIAPVVPTGQPLNEEEGVVLANTFYSHFVQCALVKAGRGDLVLGMIRKRYNPMIERGATTLWESYEPTASLCHGFSATPTYQLTSGLLGLRPEGLSFARLRIAPLPTDLERLEGLLDTVHGGVEARLFNDRDQLRLEANLPEGLNFEVSAPEGWSLVEGPSSGNAIRSGHEFKWIFQRRTPASH